MWGLLISGIPLGALGRIPIIPLDVFRRVLESKSGCRASDHPPHPPLPLAVLPDRRTWYRVNRLTRRSWTMRPTGRH
jgi:hypothetical protein